MKHFAGDFKELTDTLVPLMNVLACVFGRVTSAL